MADTRVDLTREEREAAMAGNVTTRLCRGQDYTFTAYFFEDTEQTLPLTPTDPSIYPMVEVVDVNGTALQTGTGTELQPGVYQFSWSVPLDAELTTDGRKYRINWIIITDGGRQTAYSEQFDVFDADIAQYEDRSQTYIGIEGKTEPIFILMTEDPFDINVEVSSAKSPTNVLFSATKASMQTIQTGGQILYQVELPISLMKQGMYQIIWSVRQKAVSRQENLFQMLVVPNRCFFNYVPSMRMFIDKLQKRAGQIQAYTESDIVEYLMQGLNLVNGVHPNTVQYDICNIPSGLQPYLITSASLWGLNAQSILEGELQFSFSGQTITLDYDHSGALESALGRMDSFMEKLPRVKEGFMRRATPTGIVGTRPISYRGLNNFVYPVESTNSQNLIQLLSNFGLL